VFFVKLRGLFLYRAAIPSINFLILKGFGESGIASRAKRNCKCGQAGVCVTSVAAKGFRTLQGFGTLLTAEGKVVKTFTISGIQTILNVQDLQPGIYILKFENAENVVIKRLVIQ
jgi:hypothetical protein